MAVNQLKVSRLTRLHARWMGLNEHFPLVAHCCATQEGPVAVLAKTKDGESVKMKSISSAVLSRLHWRRSDIDLLDVNFSGPAEALAFESSLHAGLWTSIAKLPLRQLDLMWSEQVVPYTEVQTIQIPNDDRTWYAHCAFSREWDHLSGNQRSGKRYEWLDAVGPLAAESLEICRSMFRIDVPTIDEYCSPLNPWLSVVYLFSQPDIHPPRKFSDTCFECNGAKLDLGDRTVELQRPESATVMSSTTWLRVDLATASANVLERLLDDFQSGRELSPETPAVPLDEPKTAGEELSVALDEVATGRLNADIAHRKIVLTRELAPDRIPKESTREWVKAAIDVLAKQGKCPSWAELSRLVGPSDRTIAESKYFGKHKEFKNAVKKMNEGTSGSVACSGSGPSSD